MLAWTTKEVESPYGSVSTLHWAVTEAEDAYPSADGAGASSSGSAKSCGEVNAETKVALESAEDQLGAVLWNSNTASLYYLHNSVFAHHPRLRGSSFVLKEAVTEKAQKQEKGAPPPLEGLRIIELGAGVGCLGIALAMGGARVAVTDLKELVPLMNHNVSLNASRVRRVASRMAGTAFGTEAACTALTWKWGPSASLNPKKQLKKQQQQWKKSSSADGKNDEAGLLSSATRAALEALTAPSESWLECSRTALNGREVDYIVLCDALYGNPKDWPSLLYTLGEILEANPGGCQIINFCEQRVNNVEGAFLTLLQEENAKPKYTPADDDKTIAKVVELYQNSSSSTGSNNGTEVNAQVASAFVRSCVAQEAGGLRMGDAKRSPVRGEQ